MYIVLKPADEI